MREVRLIILITAKCPSEPELKKALAERRINGMPTKLEVLGCSCYSEHFAVQCAHCIPFVFCYLEREDG